MTYMMLLRGDESAWMEMSEEDQKHAIAAYMSYNAELAAAGVLKGGAGLQPSYTATTLRGKDGKIEVIDGPYAESREQVGGFYLIEVDDLDAALHWAKKCPMVWGGTVEVRPVDTVPAELGG